MALALLVSMPRTEPEFQATGPPWPPLPLTSAPSEPRPEVPLLNWPPPPTATARVALPATVAVPAGGIELVCVNSSTPALMFVPPLKVLLPESVQVPAPFLVTASVPAPLVSTPLYVPMPEGALTVSVAVLAAALLSTVPPEPVNVPTARLLPCTSSTPPLTVRPPLPRASSAAGL